MSKKYTIEIEAETIGEAEVAELASSLEDVSTNADAAKQSLGEYSDETEDATKTNEEYTKSEEKSGSAIRSTVAGIAQGVTTSFLWRGAMSKVVGFLPILGTALAVITAALILYNKALKSANDYLNSSLEAQQKMLNQTVATKAWASVWEDVSIWFGEFFHSFRDFWSFFKDIVGKNVLRGLGLEEYIAESQEAIDAQKKLGVEWEKNLTTIQELTYASEDALKIANDETKSDKERLKATSEWASSQIKILALKRQRLQAELILNKAEKERSEDTEKALIVINRELDANARAMQEVSITSADMAKNILYVEQIVEDTTDAFVKNKISVEQARQAYHDFLTQVEEDAQRFNAAMGEVFDFEDEELGDEEVDGVVETYNIRKEAGEDYNQWLDESLIAAGGMWGQYFALLKDLYGEDLDWANLNAQRKIAVVGMTAQATLNIAGELINQLASLASDDFETQKKYQIAAATIDTLSGMVAAFMGGVATIPGPWGVVLGAVLAAATGVAGYLTIDKIRSSTPENPISSASMGSGSVSGVSSAPTLSLVSPLTTGEEQLAGAIGEQTSEPQKAYVVSEDMSSQQALDRRIENNASL